VTPALLLQLDRAAVPRERSVRTCDLFGRRLVVIPLERRDLHAVQWAVVHFVVFGLAANADADIPVTPSATATVSAETRLIMVFVSLLVIDAATVAASRVVTQCTTVRRSDEAAFVVPLEGAHRVRHRGQIDAAVSSARPKHRGDRQMHRPPQGKLRDGGVRPASSLCRRDA
jgi:hypothetical protein